ncbi:MAG: T9SS type A sorting domain-containing protein [Roseivirga sp.]|nr:T9SS type A sorting domain-containing protein [Roseivirga sp.]
MRLFLVIFLIIFVNTFSYGFRQGFTEMGEETGLGVAFSRGISVVDFDNDGFDDLYIARKNRHNTLFRNIGDGTFEDVAEMAGVDLVGDYNQSIWADYDNDGFLDFYLTTETGDKNLLFHNNGDQTFTDVTLAAGLDISDFTTAAIWGDVNGDGFKDLFIFLLMEDDRFFLNNGDGTFSDYTAESGISMARLSMGATFIDYDLDHDLDLYVAHDGHSGNFLFENDGGGLFKDVSVSTGILSDSEGMGVSVGDFNNDGWPDLYLTNRLQNYLFRNNEGESFTEISSASGVGDEGMGWGVSWLDFDNDGFLDLYIGNDSDYSDYANVLYRNNGDETFTKLFEEEPLAGDKGTYGTAISDLDHDGDPDLVIANRGTVDRSEVFINELDNNNHWLIIRLMSEAMDRVPVGAMVMVETAAATHTRYVLSGTSWSADDSKSLHFGLGSVSQIETVHVTWPDGTTDEYRGLQVDMAYLLNADGTNQSLSYEYVPLKNNGTGGAEGVITGIDEPVLEKVKISAYPNPFTKELALPLSLERSDRVTVTLVSYAGTESKGLYSSKLYPGEQTLRIPVVGLSSGLYLLQITIGDQQYYQKILKTD